MEPTEYTEVIKLLLRHDTCGVTPVAVDEKGNEYELTVFIDGDHNHPGTYNTLTIEAQKITD